LRPAPPFRERLKRWVRRHDTRFAKPIAGTLASVVPVRRAAHVQTRRRYGKFRPESGTYLVSHGLLHRPGHGLSALRRHDWDVIIVDEAHHGAARKALMAVAGSCRYRLLLTATPFRLATRDDPTFVATKLRRFLSMGDPQAPSPRLVALRTWSQRRWREDIEASLTDGCPRKTIVFTAWVGERISGEAASLQKTLSAAFLAALEAVRQRHHKHWRAWQMAGEHWIRGLDRRLSIPRGVRYRRWEKQARVLPAILGRLAKDELAAVLVGASKKFRRRLGRQLQRQLDLIADTWKDYAGSSARSSVEGRAARRRLNDAVAELERWGEHRGLTCVERYTGSEHRITRDRAAAGFREVTSPWVLVASNVGAEGIDLHTYTRRIVHYDLEWNPARMEQREGRGDRVGRVLRDPLSIVYCLVPRTYDERMFHQLVARDRWHGVLLGKAAATMASDEGAQHVRLESAEFIKKVRLNLAPR